jgi:acetyltransferase-like isoleucine patch superfamily enzyme
MTIVGYVRLLMGRLRAVLLSVRGATVGSRVTIGHQNRCDCPSQVSFGPRATTESNVWIKIESPDGSVQIGEYSFLGRNTEVDCILSVVIGDRTLIAPNVFITDHNHNTRGTGRIAEQGCVSAPVHIGNDVWIGTGAVILPGVIIGDGAVVAAGAVVTKCIPALEVWAGVPARCIRIRTES